MALKDKCGDSNVLVCLSGFSDFPVCLSLSAPSPLVPSEGALTAHQCIVSSLRKLSNFLHQMVTVVFS